jgi:hypothetical protein
MLRKLLKTESMRYVIKGSGFFILCLLFMMMANPAKTSLAELLIPFVLFGLGTFMFTSVVVHILYRSAGDHMRRFIALTASVSLVVMLLLRSLNQFTIRDGVILIVLVICMTLYVTRADFLGETSSNRDKPSV